MCQIYIGRVVEGWGEGGGHYNIKWCGTLERYQNLMFLKWVPLHFLGHSLSLCALVSLLVSPPPQTDLDFPVPIPICVAYMEGGVVVVVQITLGWFKHSLSLFIHTPDRTIHHEACNLR